MNAPLTPMTPEGLPGAAAPPCGLCGVADRVAVAGNDERVSVAEMREALGRNAIAPLMLLPALIAVSPISAVFGVATVCGLTIALVSLSALRGREEGPALPGWLLRLSLPRTRLIAMRRRMRPVLAWIDRRARTRLRVLTRWPVTLVSDAVCLTLGLLMPLMEMVPMSATTAGFAVTLMAVGRLQGDGAMVVAGLCAAVLVLFLPFLVASALF